MVVQPVRPYVVVDWTWPRATRNLAALRRRSKAPVASTLTRAERAGEACCAAAHVAVGTRVAHLPQIGRRDVRLGPECGRSCKSFGRRAGELWLVAPWSRRCFVAEHALNSLKTLFADAPLLLALRLLIERFTVAAAGSAAARCSRTARRARTASRAARRPHMLRGVRASTGVSRPPNFWVVSFRTWKVRRCAVRARGAKRARPEVCSAQAHIASSSPFTSRHRANQQYSPMRSPTPHASVPSPFSSPTTGTVGRRSGAVASKPDRQSPPAKPSIERPYPSIICRATEHATAHPARLHTARAAAAVPSEGRGHDASRDRRSRRCKPNTRPRSHNASSRSEGGRLSRDVLTTPLEEPCKPIRRGHDPSRGPCSRCPSRCAVV
jgi:hypothetical protein